MQIELIDKAMDMKKLFLLILLSMMCMILCAQWRVEESYESGKKYLSGIVQSNNKEAELFFFKNEDDVILAMKISHIFNSQINDVVFKFNVNGLRKSHTFMGLSDQKGQLLLVQLENVDNPFVGEFLDDFKKANELNVYIGSETYRFSMAGSTKAYNSVLNQTNSTTNAAVTYSSSKNLYFKGHPISGNVKQFSSILQKEGFSIVNGEDDVLKGKFDGKDVVLALITTPKTETMCGVLVEFATFRTWKSIKQEFDQLEKRLTAKYGNPTSKMRKFVFPYEEGDGYEMDAVYLGKCIYVDYFEMEIGTIAITITKSPQDGNAAILLAYYDKKGVALKNKEEASADDL